MTKEKRRTESPCKTADDVREQWTGGAEDIIRAGKSHMGIITFLRSKGQKLMKPRGCLMIFLMKQSADCCEVSSPTAPLPGL